MFNYFFGHNNKDVTDNINSYIEVQYSTFSSFEGTCYETVQIESSNIYALLDTINENPIKYILNNIYRGNNNVNFISVKIKGNNNNNNGGLLHKVALYMGLDTTNINSSSDLSKMVDDHMKYNPDKGFKINKEFNKLNEKYNNEET